MLDTAQPLADKVVEKLKERFPRLNPTIKLARMNGMDLPGSPWELLHDNKPTDLLIDRTFLEEQGVDAVVETISFALQSFDYDRAVVKRQIQQFPEVLFYAKLRSLNHKDKTMVRAKAIDTVAQNWGCSREEAEEAIIAYTKEDPAA